MFAWFEPHEAVRETDQISPAILHAQEVLPGRPEAICQTRPQTDRETRLPKLPLKYALKSLELQEHIFIANSSS